MSGGFMLGPGALRRKAGQADSCHWCAPNLSVDGEAQDPFRRLAVTNLWKPHLLALNSDIIL